MTIDMSRAKLNAKKGDYTVEVTYAKGAILYSQRNSIGSQCSSFNRGVTVSPTFLQNGPWCTVLSLCHRPICSSNTRGL